MCVPQPELPFCIYLIAMATDLLLDALHPTLTPRPFYLVVVVPVGGSA